MSEGTLYFDLRQRASGNNYIDYLINYLIDVTFAYVTIFNNMI
ncbi:Putative uncharacterized protein [Moritella viscosa]|nr:Putative uncharacterized protein [Moritella viscosa]SHN96905.1 Putative uncharacterized protein [Moritella viscosa]SHN96929.1 Putative uncharacterized protein [Moritella viscosa]SHO19531.1 Putative uncharacterized protein [Moritella viscosa]